MCVKQLAVLLLVIVNFVFAVCSLHLLLAVYNKLLFLSYCCKLHVTFHFIIHTVINNLLCSSVCDSTNNT